MNYSMINRNLLVYFRDKTSVFFSLLSVIIVIALYVMFLARIQVDSVLAVVGDGIKERDISWMINSWILAGLLSIISVTSTLSALNVMVQDKEKKIIKDFKSAPINFAIYPFSIIVSSCIVGILMNLVALGAFSAFIYLYTGHVFTALQYTKVLGLILFSVLMAATIMTFMVSCFSTNGAFSSASVIVGTLIGFLTGVYVPVGTLPEAVQTVIKLLPFGHVASLFRKVLMENAINKVFDGAPLEIVSEYRRLYGVQYVIAGREVSFYISFLYAMILTIIFIALFILNFNRKRKEI
ncbi:ABC transporter permease [Herbivorax sp. ANBcel31]|uniref:ABC transporter permease n=1 Tax=Herbivorax sp. ANBcel31 TaxID=3069754 RepID=UPI0027B1CE57|nr:ABC transporter permease [Herbivorax sp. ANBcel31]MDQ2085434.1 ABC transporter permease [Herbivorax sp. ANBcel31]